MLYFLDAGAVTHSWPIPRALTTIAQADSGVLVLLYCAETSVELFSAFDAASSPDVGDEVARHARMDLRTYGIGAQILRDLNVRRMKLLARPRKMPSMAGFGLHATGFIEH